MPQRGTLGPERCSKCGSLLYIDGDGAQPCLKCAEMADQKNKGRYQVEIYFTDKADEDDQLADLRHQPDIFDTKKEAVAWAETKMEILKGASIAQGVVKHFWAEVHDNEDGESWRVDPTAGDKKKGEYSYRCPKCGKTNLSVIHCVVDGRMTLFEDGFLISGDTTEEIVECNECGHQADLGEFTREG
jgi:DNA-directed RNA polymerase subunit M/transcription elongation factor TFIIS